MYLINSVSIETGLRLDTAKPGSVSDVRNNGGTLVAFSEQAAADEKTIKAFLFERMYRHERVNRVMQDAEALVRDLFARYQTTPSDLPKQWLSEMGKDDGPSRARRIGDFIAGMTDRFAMDEHKRLFDSTPELR